MGRDRTQRAEEGGLCRGEDGGTRQRGESVKGKEKNRSIALRSVSVRMRVGGEGEEEEDNWGNNHTDTSYCLRGICISLVPSNRAHVPLSLLHSQVGSGAGWSRCRRLNTGSQPSLSEFPLHSHSSTPRHHHHQATIQWGKLLPPPFRPRILCTQLQARVHLNWKEPSLWFMLQDATNEHAARHSAS